jgi:hemerythrin-like metal-binding protein
VEDPVKPIHRPFQTTTYPPMDQDHDRIWGGLERLLDAVRAGKPKEAVLILGTVSEQFMAHFAMEEQRMAETGYALAARHKEAHDLFLLDLHTNVASLKAQGFSPPFRRWATGRALEWFRFHIAANDVGLGHHLTARDRTGRAPVPSKPRAG